IATSSWRPSSRSSATSSVRRRTRLPNAPAHSEMSSCGRGSRASFKSRRRHSSTRSTSWRRAGRSRHDRQEEGLRVGEGHRRRDRPRADRRRVRDGRLDRAAPAGEAVVTVEELTDLIYVPFDRTPGEGSWTSGGFNTVDESKVGPFGKEDVAEVLYGGSSGDGWDGRAAGGLGVVLRADRRWLPRRRLWRRRRGLVLWAGQPLAAGQAGARRLAASRAADSRGEGGRASC